MICKYKSKLLLGVQQGTLNVQDVAFKRNYYDGYACYNMAKRFIQSIAEVTNTK